jgi:hypothetical protein
MKKEFYETYEVLYNEFIFEGYLKPERKTPDEYYILRIIRKTINEIATEKHLRSDAKYFLIVNFHFLVVKPLCKQKPRGRYLLEELYPSLEEDIKNDIILIIKSADEESKDQEISGHQIMQSIDKLWKKLKTTSFEIWG